MPSKINAWTFSFGLLFSSLAFAAASLLPTFQTQQEKQAFVEETKKLIPFATENSIQFLDFQIQALALLRQRFPEYDQWMKEKPDLLTIEIFEQALAREQTPILDKQILEKIRQKIQLMYDQELSQIPQKDIPKELWERGLVELVTTLMKPLPSASARGLIVGLAQVLSTENRIAFFKRADPLLQLQYFESLNISDQVLRESSFKAATLGLDQKTVSVKEVIAIAYEKIGDGSEIFHLLSYLKAVFNLKLGNQNLQFMNQLTATDFEFALQLQDLFLDELIEEIVARGLMSRGTLVQHLRRAQASVQRKWFTYEIAEKKILRPFAKVIEVNPHLAVYRGCIGGDCSTTYSPLFPYSPWEHDFYIKNAKDQFIGYISGARVQVGDKTAFYLRDIQGPHLSPAIVDAILHAFPQALSHFRVDQFLLMNRAFVSQNNSISLRSLLDGYQARGRAIPILFTDAQIRAFISSTQSFRSISNYDGVHSHPNGTSFEPNPQIQNRFHYRITQELPPVARKMSPEERGHAFFDVLRMRYEKVQKSTYDDNGFSEVEIKRGMEIMLNKKALPAKEYNEQIKKMFEENALKWSRTWRDQLKSLFLTGLLNSPNAFSDPDYQSLTSAYFFELLDEHYNYSLIVEIAFRQAEQLKNSHQFQEKLRSMGERLNPHDVFQLVVFKALGYREAAMFLTSTSSKARELIEEAVVRHTQPEFSESQISIVLEKAPLAILGRIFGVARSLRSSGPNYVHGIDSALQIALGEYGLHLNQIKNRDLLLKFRSLYLQAKDLDEHFARFAPLMIEAAKSNAFDAFRIYKLIEKSGRRDELINSFLEERLEAIQQSPYRENRSPELYILVQLGYTPAIDLLKNYHLRRSYIADINSALEQVDRGPSNAINQMFSQFRGTHFLRPEKIVETIRKSGEGISIAQLTEEADQFARQLHISPDEFLSIEQVKKNWQYNWLFTTDAFTNPKSEVVNKSLEILTRELSNPYYAYSGFAASKLLPHLRYLSQKSGFDLMIKTAYRSLLEGVNRELNARILVTAIQQKLIPDYLTNNLQGLYALRITDIREYQILASQMAKKRNLKLASHDYILENQPMPEKPLFKPLLKKAIAILQEGWDEIGYFFSRGAQKTEDMMAFKVRANLLPINAEALKEAHRFVRHGGNPSQVLSELTGHYNRAELSDDTANSKDLASYRKLIKKAGGFAGSCGNLFSKMHSRPYY